MATLLEDVADQAAERLRRRGDVTLGAAVHQADDMRRGIDEGRAGVAGDAVDRREERVAEARQGRAAAGAVELRFLEARVLGVAGEIENRAGDRRLLGDLQRAQRDGLLE